MRYEPKSFSIAEDIQGKIYDIRYHMQANANDGRYHLTLNWICGVHADPGQLQMFVAP